MDHGTDRAAFGNKTLDVLELRSIIAETVVLPMYSQYTVQYVNHMRAVN